jgi:hypothetical protein
MKPAHIQDEKSSFVIDHRESLLSVRQLAATGCQTGRQVIHAWFVQGRCVCRIVDFEIAWQCHGNAAAGLAAPGEPTSCRLTDAR